MSIEWCPGYVGVACVNGNCPKAWQEEYAERDYPVIKSCKDCGYYKGCTDCAVMDTSDCPKTYSKKTKRQL